MHSKQSFTIAFGGVLAALAIVIMSLGGLIPVATYVCPLLCAVILQVVLDICGTKLAWAWYGAVSILSMLFSADKEAACTFLFLGYYPIVKPTLDCKKLKWFWKILLFNGSVGLMYFLLLKVLGLEELNAEFGEIGNWMLISLLALGNLSFVLLDRVLTQDPLRRLIKYGK